MKKTTHAHLALWGKELAMPMITHMGTNCYRHAVKLDEDKHDGFELVFVLKGEQTYELENGDLIEIKGGQFSFMHPGIIHKGKDGYEAPFQSCWMIFSPLANNATSGTPFSMEDLHEINMKYSSFETTVSDFNTNLQNTLHRFRMAFYDYYSSNFSALSLPLLRSLACEIIIDSSRQLEMNKKGSKLQKEQSVIKYGNAAIKYIEDHVFDTITVAKLARYLGFSPSRTFEIFKQHTGQSPIDYQLRMRIKVAQKKLNEKSTNITQIAYDCGFNSSQYFSRVFRRYVGKSPTEFKKIIQSKD